MLQSAIRLLRCLSKKKKKVPGRVFVIVVSFCLFCKSCNKSCLTFPAGKDEHGCTKFSGTLGMRTKILGFQVYHLC